MMILSPIDDQVYEAAQKQIGYAKLFPYILADFATRKDVALMMKPSNLPVSTAVNTVVAGLAAAVPVVGTGLGKGTGTTIPIYTCQTPSPASAADKAIKEGIVNSGGVATKAAIGS